MDIVKFSLHKNPFIGLFFKASDKHVLIPSTIEEKTAKIFEETLKVQPIKLLIDHSRLLGIFSALNSNGCIVPSFAGDHEIKILKSHGLNVLRLDKFSPGNTVLRFQTRRRFLLQILPLRDSLFPVYYLIRER